MILVLVLAAAITGCTKPVDASEASPFSIYRIKDGVRFSLGDKRDNIEKIIDINPDIIVEFEEDEEATIFEQVIYEDVAFDYDREGNILGLETRRNNWKIANGLKVTDSIEDVKKNYPAEYRHTYEQNNDIYISLDGDGNMIEFSTDAPYILRFEIEQYAISRIIIKKNIY